MFLEETRLYVVESSDNRRQYHNGVQTNDQACTEKVLQNTRYYSHITDAHSVNEHLFAGDFRFTHIFTDTKLKLSRA